MADHETLFEEANGKIFDAFIILEIPNKFVPPRFATRTRDNRKKIEKGLGKLLKSGKLEALPKLKEWADNYEKECFWNGLRALFELQRDGKTKI